MINLAIDNAALFAVLSSLADNKQAMGWRYAFWCNGAPSLEAAVAAAAMTQDEVGHARSLYPLLDQFVQGQADPMQTEPMTRTLRYHVSALDHDFAGWADFIATNFLLDTALTTCLAAALESTYDPLRTRLRKMVQEERIHFMHAEGWIRRLAQAGGGVRANLVAALQRQWDETLCWFGPEPEGPVPPESPVLDDPAMQRLAREGIIDAAPGELRRRYLGKIMPVLDGAGITMPVARDPATAAWVPTHDLPWSRWDATARRLAATP